METIVLSNPSAFEGLWNLLKGLNPYLLSFVNTIPSALATVVVSVIVTRGIVKRWEDREKKEDKKLDSIQEKQNEFEIRLIKLETKKK